MPDELQFVDLRASHDRDLLDAVHRDLFVPNFRDEDEQEDPDDWAPRLWGDDPSLPEQQKQFSLISSCRTDGWARTGRR